MKWQNRAVYHSINPGGPNGFDTQAAEWLQIEPLGCSSPRAAALSQQYILCWLPACQLPARLFLLPVLVQCMGFSFVLCLFPVSLHKPWKQEKKTAAGSRTSGCQSPEWHAMRELLCHREGSWARTFLKCGLALEIQTFISLIQLLFVNPAQKALIPSVKWYCGFPPKALVTG